MFSGLESRIKVKSERGGFINKQGKFYKEKLCSGLSIWHVTTRGWGVRKSADGGPVVSSAVWDSVFFGWEQGLVCVTAIPSALRWAFNAALTPFWRRGHAASHLEPITLEGLWQGPHHPLLSAPLSKAAHTTLTVAFFFSQHHALFVSPFPLSFF